MNTLKYILFLTPFFLLGCFDKEVFTLSITTNQNALALTVGESSTIHYTIDVRAPNDNTQTATLMLSELVPVGLSSSSDNPGSINTRTSTLVEINQTITAEKIGTFRIEFRAQIGSVVESIVLQIEVTMTEPKPIQKPEVGPNLFFFNMNEDIEVTPNSSETFEISALMRDDVFDGTEYEITVEEKITEGRYEFSPDNQKSYIVTAGGSIFGRRSGQINRITDSSRNRY